MGNANPTSDAAMPAVKAAISSMADTIQKQRITTGPMGAPRFSSPGWKLSESTMPAAMRSLEACGDLMEMRMRQYYGPAGLHTEAAGWEDDLRRATDIMVLTFRAMRLAVRVRAHRNLNTHSGSFTIRTHTSSGNPNSEILKLRQGFGDFLLYAWANSDGIKLDAGVVIDLHVWRKHEFGVPHKEWSNGARSGGRDLSAFNSYQFNDFPPELIVYSFDYRQGLW